MADRAQRRPAIRSGKGNEWAEEPGRVEPQARRGWRVVGRGGVWCATAWGGRAREKAATSMGWRRGVLYERAEKERKRLPRDQGSSSQASDRQGPGDHARSRAGLTGCLQTDHTAGGVAAQPQPHDGQGLRGVQRSRSSSLVAPLLPKSGKGSLGTHSRSAASQSLFCQICPDVAGPSSPIWPSS